MSSSFLIQRDVQIPCLLNQNQTPRSDSASLEPSEPIFCPQILEPRFDVPGHSSSWQIGYPGLSSRCATPDLRRHPLDPTRESTYALIKTLLAEVDPLFGDEFPFWHMGGDEVSYGCWRNSTGGYIDRFMAANGIAKGDYAALQAHFEQRVVGIVRGLPSHKRTVLWEDASTSHTSGLPQDAVVELWQERGGNATVVDATVKAGRQIIWTSPDWYFSQHQGAAKQYQEVADWEFVYTRDPYANSTLPTSELDRAFLGGESAMWSPYFDSANFLTQAFPRAAAVAERLWSAQNVTEVYDAGVRLHAWRCRLLRRGLATAPVTGGLAIGSFGTAPPHIPHDGGHCADGPWEPTYTPPWEDKKRTRLI